ncbi:D-alanyl-D-alanine carboxypeptidase family protein [Polymorphobacter sp.]|uniref:D-alanyl-D-alanine carboxypeptidase family protein n=1 Tax=Polymorphobacter sp. TaxID=1909290 RepID=UPI003F721F6C
MFQHKFQIIAAISCLGFAVQAPAQELTAGFTTPAPYAFMKDLGSGTILYSKGADTRIPPASMGKMMTVYVAFSLIKAGEAQMTQTVTVRPETWRAWHSQGSTMFLSANEQVSVEDLLHGIVTLSGNDACVVLAEGLAGSEQAYVALMNRAAEKLGMKGSRFANTNGWPDPNEYVTARDLATVAEATIRDFPDLYQRFYGKENFTWGKTLGEGKAITQSNRNPILGKVRGADGLKTGHTEEAGYGFTGSAAQDGRRLVMVVGGLTSFNQRISASTDFMNWGFSAWTRLPILKANAVAGKAPVGDGAEPEVNLVAPRDLFVLVPRGLSGDRKQRLVLDGPVTAPVAKGQKLATLVVSVPGRGETRLPLVAATAVAEAGPMLKAWNWAKGLVGQ